MIQRITLSILLLVVSIAANSAPVDGLIVTTSRHPVQETAERAVVAIEARGLKLMARIDHAAGAHAAGMQLNPTQLLIFGNPKSGTPLMHCAITFAIDLPLKLLIWEDGEGVTRVAYNAPDWLGRRHGRGQCAPILKKMSTALSAIAADAGN